VVGDQREKQAKDDVGEDVALKILGSKAGVVESGRGLNPNVSPLHRL
jgi:hypothetical protein